MNMNITKKEIFLILGLLGVAAAVLVYFNVYTPSMEKFDQLTAENANLSSEVARLEGLVTQRELFIEETESVNKEAQELLDQFPANITPEDTIREAIEIDTNGSVDIGSMSYGSQATVYNMIAKSAEEMPSQSTASTVNEEGSEGEDSEGEGQVEANAQANAAAALNSGVETLVQPLTLTYSCSLDQFLQIVRYVNEQNNRDVISNVSLAYDSSTGLLASQMEIDKYYIVGLDRDEDYQPATFTTPVGSSNLFSTYISGTGVAASSETEEGEAEGGDAEEAQN